MVLQNWEMVIESQSAFTLTFVEQVNDLAISKEEQFAKKMVEIIWHKDHRNGVDATLDNGSGST